MKLYNDNDISVLLLLLSFLFVSLFLFVSFDNSVMVLHCPIFAQNSCGHLASTSLSSRARLAQKQTGYKHFKLGLPFKQIAIICGSILVPDSATVSRGRMCKESG